MSRVAILGSGPAGLLAALAAEQVNHTPHIFAIGAKSPMFGAMYLHEPIPGLTGDHMAPDFTIDVRKAGTRFGYAANVYGNPQAKCSWDDIAAGTTPAWDLHKAYDTLWDRYSEGIQHSIIGVNELTRILAAYPLVLSTIPARHICRHLGCVFKQQPITIAHGPGEARLVTETGDNNVMLYNGMTKEESGFDWYRFSQIRGYQSWEHSGDRSAEVATLHSETRRISTGVKPLMNTCECWMGFTNLVKLGRFGKWQKGVLTHHAYREAREACLALQ